ncbi:MAG: hypothetical protein K5750_07725 [Eubacterium sp.]|nr:hypothetical protein [Eubacterium sp.]
MKKVKSRAASVLLASAMALSLTSCGKDDDKKDDTTAKSEEVTTEATSGDDTTTEATTEEPQKVLASVDFEDDKFDFVAVSSGSGRDKSELSIADFAGSKALKVTNTEGGNMFIAINVSALLGDDVEKLSSIVLDIGTENTDGSGKFYASSGLIYSYTGESNSEVKGNAWSVYLDTANPKTATFDVSGAGFVAGKDNYIIISKETDNAPVAQNIYIDNIAFLDASGATLTADSSAEFGNPSGFASAVDRSNLYGLTDAVEVEGFAVKGDAWSQNGVELKQEVIDKLVPGSVIEISYASESGNIWPLFNAAQAGWIRLGAGTNDASDGSYGVYNNSHNVFQVTYEQVAAALGDDVSTWGTSLQCESDSAWEVKSVKIGKAAPNYSLQDAVVVEGFAIKGDAWSQNGVELKQEALDALVPGSAIEITYSSETGAIWPLFNAAQAGWIRLGAGARDASDGSYAVMDGNTCYVTYEQIAAALGEDKATWGTSLQCESDGAWEVKQVRIGKAAPFKQLTNLTKVEGFAVKGDAWSQNGMDLPQEALDALVPGSVITFNYTSDTGNIWLLFNGAQAGWIRVGAGANDASDGSYAILNGSVCQITYEQFAAALGEDKSTWGTSLQAEADGAYEVTALYIGQSSDSAAASSATPSDTEASSEEQ